MAMTILSGAMIYGSLTSKLFPDASFASPLIDIRTVTGSVSATVLLILAYLFQTLVLDIDFKQSRAKRTKMQLGILMLSSLTTAAVVDAVLRFGVPYVITTNFLELHSSFGFDAYAQDGTEASKVAFLVAVILLTSSITSVSKSLSIPFFRILASVLLVFGVILCLASGVANKYASAATGGSFGIDEEGDMTASVDTTSSTSSSVASIDEL